MEAGHPSKPVLKHRNPAEKIIFEANSRKSFANVQNLYQ